jgi:hypothetical protein
MTAIIKTNIYAPVDGLTYEIITTNIDTEVSKDNTIDILTDLELKVQHYLVANRRMEPHEGLVANRIKGNKTRYYQTLRVKPDHTKHANISGSPEYMIEIMHFDNTKMNTESCYEDSNYTHYDAIGNLVSNYQDNVIAQAFYKAPVYEGGRKQKRKTRKNTK